LSVIGSPFSEQSFKTYEALWMMILGPPLREEGHEVAEGVHVQLRQECSVGEKGPPGKKSEPRSLDSSGEGN